MPLIVLLAAGKFFYWTFLYFSIQNEIEPPPIDTTWMETTSKKAALKVWIVIQHNFI